MSLKKPSRAEEEYFARQDAFEKHILAVQSAKRMAAEERERRRREHYMKCPKCGMDLQTIVYRGITIDKCFHCNGTWLDAGELEEVAGAGGDLVSRIAALFRSGPGPLGPDLV